MLTAFDVYLREERSPELALQMEPVAKVLPKAAAESIRRAALTPGTYENHRARVIAIEKAIANAKIAYPHLFQPEI